MTIRSDLALVVVTASGSITVGDFVENRRTLLAHPDFRPDLHMLCDLTGGTFRPDLSTIRKWSAVTPFSSASRRAIVVPDALHYGLARMWGSFIRSEAGEFRPFLSLEDACDWLGIDEEAVLAGAVEDGVAPEDLGGVIPRA